MASTETAPAPKPEKVVETPAQAEREKVEQARLSEVKKAVEQPPEVKAPVYAPSVDYFALADVVLRFLLFASAVVAVVVIVTSKQTQKGSPAAKFIHSPAFRYFVAALSVTGLYSIITILLSLYVLLIKPGFCPQLLSHFVIIDVLLLGIVAAAAGSSGTVAYTGLKGNSHFRWGKFCNVYDKFCRHVGASVAVSLFASILLAFLVLLSIYSLSKKIPK